MAHRDDDAEHPILDAAREAALAAEYDTGEREATEAVARSHILVRTARMAFGTAVVMLGIIMMPLPGPGGLVVAGGLVILARDVAWADRLLRYFRHKMPGVPADGKIPRSSLITMAVLALAGMTFSLWFTLR
jgi:uncharacterized protein (TIGR02611 family)